MTVESLKKCVLGRQENQILAYKRQAVYEVKWNANGTRFGTMAYDPNIRIWPIEARGNDSTELRGHEQPVNAIAWHPENAHVLASGANDRTVRLWDVNSRRAQHVVKLQGEASSLAWNDSGDYLCVGTRNDVICTWDVRANKMLQQSQLQFEIHQLHWSNGCLFCCAEGGDIHVFDGKSLEELGYFSTHIAHVYCLATHPSSQVFATGGSDALVNIWDATTQICISNVDRLRTPARAICYTTQGNLLICATEDGLLDFSMPMSGQYVESFTSPWKSLLSIAFNPRYPVLATAGEDVNGDGIVRLLNFKGL